MNTRKIVIGAVMIVIGLPVVAVLTAGVSFYASFYALNRTNGTIVSSGQKREYLLYVSRSYDRTKPTPLVISMHAASLWPAAQMETSQWNKVADEHGFIVVYPSGLSGNGPRVFHVGRGPALGKDVRFISDLIDTLKASYNIDLARVYANGLSNGGGMSFALSCALPTRIAAVGLVASAQTMPWSLCTDTHAVPMIAFHGTDDTAAPYHGGNSWV